MRPNKTAKVKVQGYFHRLQINKSLRFQTNILWKRHQSKVETRLVNHQHGYSIYEESLTLEFNLVYDQAKGLYEDKNTEIVAIISHEGKVKSGGYAKYNIAQVFNNSLEGKLVTIPLSQCPDPNANVQVTFTYTFEEDGVSQVGSVLNASSRDFNMSRVDFHDDKISLQMDRINATITKLDQLAQHVKSKEKKGLQKVPLLMMRVEQLEGQNQTLKNNLKRLEDKLAGKEAEQSQRAKKDQKTINDLQKQLQKKDKDFKSKEFIQLQQQKKYKEQVNKRDKQIQKYKEQISDLQLQLQSIKKDPVRKSFPGFGRMQVGDVNQIANFQNDRQSSQRQDTSQQLTTLRNENTTLQSNVASMSYKLAQLFNAAYDFGGAKLLDYLQTAIGLTEK